MKITDFPEYGPDQAGNVQRSLGNDIELPQHLQYSVPRSDGLPGTERVHVFTGTLRHTLDFGAQDRPGNWERGIVIVRLNIPAVSWTDEVGNVPGTSVLVTATAIAAPAAFMKSYDRNTPRPAQPLYQFHAGWAVDAAFAQLDADSDDRTDPYRVHRTPDGSLYLWLLLATFHRQSPLFRVAYQVTAIGRSVWS